MLLINPAADSSPTTPSTKDASPCTNTLPPHEGKFDDFWVEGLSGFRFYIYLWVILLHTVKPLPELAWTRSRGDVGIFFAISGLLTDISWERSSKESALRFAAKRVSRLYFPCYLSLVLFSYLFRLPDDNEGDKWEFFKAIFMFPLALFSSERWRHNSSACFVATAALHWILYPVWRLYVVDYLKIIFRGRPRTLTSVLGAVSITSVVLTSLITHKPGLVVLPEWSNVSPWVRFPQFLVGVWMSQVLVEFPRLGKSDSIWLGCAAAMIADFSVASWLIWERLSSWVFNIGNLEEFYVLNLFTDYLMTTIFTVVIILSVHVSVRTFKNQLPTQKKLWVSSMVGRGVIGRFFDSKAYELASPGIVSLAACMLHQPLSRNKILGKEDIFDGRGVMEFMIVLYFLSLLVNFANRAWMNKFQPWYQLNGAQSKS